MVVIRESTTLMRAVSTVDSSKIVVLNPQSAALKEAIDDLEWPGSSIQISLQPVPPSVTFRGEGHGDLQVLFLVQK